MCVLCVYAFVFGASVVGARGPRVEGEGRDQDYPRYSAIAAWPGVLGSG